MTVVSPFPGKCENPNYKNFALDANIMEKLFSKQSKRELFSTVTELAREQTQTILCDDIPCQVIIMETV